MHETAANVLPTHQFRVHAHVSAEHFESIPLRRCRERTESLETTSQHDRMQRSPSAEIFLVLHVRPRMRRRSFHIHLPIFLSEDARLVRSYYAIPQLQLAAVLRLQRQEKVPK